MDIPPKDDCVKFEEWFFFCFVLFFLHKPPPHYTHISHNITAQSDDITANYGDTTARNDDISQRQPLAKHEEAATQQRGKKKEKKKDH